MRKSKKFHKKIMHSIKRYKIRINLRWEMHLKDCINWQNATNRYNSLFGQRSISAKKLIIKLLLLLIIYFLSKSIFFRDFIKKIDKLQKGPDLSLEICEKIDKSWFYLFKIISKKVWKIWRFEKAPKALSWALKLSSIKYLFYLKCCD